MTDQVVPLNEDSEENVIAFVQQKRKLIVSKILKDDKLPVDKLEMSALLTALDGLDRSAIGRLRIKSDKETTNQVTGAASLMALMLSKVGSREATVLHNVPTPVLSVEDAKIMLKPDEMLIGTFAIKTDSIT